MEGFRLSNYILCRENIKISVIVRHSYSPCHQSSDSVSSNGLRTIQSNQSGPYFEQYGLKDVFESAPWKYFSLSFYFSSLQGHPKAGSHIMVIYLFLLSATDFSSTPPSYRELFMKQCEPMQWAEGEMAA